MTGETSRALTDLTKAADRASTWSDPAIWFLANTYLLLEDKQQAAFTLQRLIEADSAFSKNAVALLQELEEQQKE